MAKVATKIVGVLLWSIIVLSLGLGLISNGYSLRFVRTALGYASAVSFVFKRIIDEAAVVIFSRLSQSRRALVRDRCAMTGHSRAR